MPPWIEREKSFPVFDSSPIDGMKNLDGNQIAKKYGVDWTHDKKYPLISFPSGLERELTLRGSEAQAEPHVYLFGNLELPYKHNRDEAFDHALAVAKQENFQVAKLQDRGLVILNPESTRLYAILYDNDERRIADIRHHPEYAMELMTGELRAALPPLYSGESKGMEAVAPVKYFTPDANWTWYASEYDGKDIFFGLVSGYEVELGYFSLTELESTRGVFGLPLERDLYYEPKTLRELSAFHKQQE